MMMYFLLFCVCVCVCVRVGGCLKYGLTLSASFIHHTNITNNAICTPYIPIHIQHRAKLLSRRQRGPSGVRCDEAGDV